MVVVAAGIEDLFEDGGFVDRFVIFGHWLAVGDDATACGVVEATDEVIETTRIAVSGEKYCANSDVECGISTIADKADGPAVWPSSGGFKHIDDLHCADFWCAGN